MNLLTKKTLFLYIRRIHWSQSNKDQQAVNNCFVKKIMSELVELCEVNQASGSMTCLMAAAQQGNEAAVELLLQQPGRDVNLVDEVGYTALHFAANRGHLGVVRRLLEHPSLTCLNVRNSYGNTALMLALRNNHLKCVELLAEQEGVDMDTRKTKKLSLDELEEIAHEPWQQEALGAARELIRVVKGSRRRGQKLGKRSRKIEEERSGEEAARRKKAQEEMSDDKIDEIVQNLEATTILKSTTKKKKAGKSIKNAKTFSHQTNINEIEHKIQSCSQNETAVENSGLYELKMVGDPIKANKNLHNILKDKLRILEKEKAHALSIENTNLKELDELSITIANIEESKYRVLSEIAEIDARKAELLKSFEAKDSILGKLRNEQDILKNVVSRTMMESRAKISKMESEVQILEFQQLEKKKTSRALRAVPKNQDYLESINLKICSKEQELECPVCLETATAPILMCEDQHLICNKCRLAIYLMSPWFVRMFS